MVVEEDRVTCYFSEKGLKEGAKEKLVNKEDVKLFAEIKDWINETVGTNFSEDDIFVKVISDDEFTDMFGDEEWEGE